MLISIRVKAGASKELVERISDTKFKISVREKPQDDQANRRVIAVLAGHLQVPITKIRIVKGRHSPSKILSIPEK